MRIAKSIFVSVVLAALASPALANSASPNSHANANAQATEEAPAAAGCHAYQKGPDGNWVEMACHEGIETAPAPVRSKPASHHHADQNIAR
jgi:hypothetical protein